MQPNPISTKSKALEKAKHAIWEHYSYQIEQSHQKEVDNTFTLEDRKKRNNYFDQSYSVISHCGTEANLSTNIPENGIKPSLIDAKWSRYNFRSPPETLPVEDQSP